MHFTPQSRAGLSLLDTLAIMAIVGLLAALVLPALTRPGHRHNHARIGCVNQLKQVGLATLLWANDHEEQFPFASSLPDGSGRWVGSPEVFRHFQVMSNELVTPKILVCRADRIRQAAPDFASLSNSHLSYFVGLDAHQKNPQQILAGDRDLTGGVRRASHLLTLTPRSPVGWSRALHKEGGNLSLADGSVQQCTDATLRRQISQLTNASFRLAFP